MSRFLLLLAAIVALHAQTFRVAGTIVNSETSAPIPKAKMMLTASGKSLNFLTAGDGRFSFDVPAGKYSLTAELQGLRLSYGRRSPASSFGVAIITGPDQKTDDLTFRWFPVAALSGTITDQFNEPVEGAHVGLIRIVVLNGRKHVYYYGSFYSDDRGQYYFGHVMPGSYYITVTGAPWYAPTPLPQVIRNAAPAVSPAYAAMYYPATHDARAAAPFILKPGQEGRADFTLDEARGVSLNLHCEGGPAQKAVTLFSQGVNGFQEPARHFTMRGDRFLIPAIAPGHYAVRITSGDLEAWQEIDVSSADLDVPLTLGSPPTITGTVQFQPPSIRPPGTVRINFSYDVTGFVYARTVAADGTFSVSNATPGRNEVRGVSGDFASDVVDQDGTPRDGYLDLLPGHPAKVRVIVTAATARVKGFVKQNGQPREAAMVVLASRVDSENLSRYRAFQTDSDGSFDIQSVRAGDYYLFAADAPDLEYTNPAALHPYFAGAKPIHIDPHVVYDEILSVIEPASRNQP